MSGREFPFDPNETCDTCGAMGAFDLYGDYACGTCLNHPSGLTEGSSSGRGFGMREPGVRDLEK